MTDDFDASEYDQNYFQNFMESLTEHPDWEYSERNREELHEIVDDAAKFEGSTEVSISHTDTDGHFRLMIPHRYEPIAAATGTLDQPLDGAQRVEPYENSFGEKILEAYESVVEDFDAEYLNTESDTIPDTTSLLSINVPLDYDEETLSDTLDVADDVSREVQDLNDEVVSVLEDRI